MEKHLLLPEKLGNELLEYLGTRPLKETFNLVLALIQLKDAPEPKGRRKKPASKAE